MNTNWPAWRRERRRFDAAACGGGRQLDAEHAAASELAVDRYGAAVRGADPLADGETQTVPESTGLVVKKASKICGRASCRMPPPVSSSERENIYDDRYEPPALVLADALCTS